MHRSFASSLLLPLWAACLLGTPAPGKALNCWFTRVLCCQKMPFFWRKALPQAVCSVKGPGSLTDPIISLQCNSVDISLLQGKICLIVFSDPQHIGLTHALIIFCSASGGISHEEYVVRKLWGIGLMRRSSAWPEKDPPKHLSGHEKRVPQRAVWRDE